MPKLYPAITETPSCASPATLAPEQSAADFGIHDMTLSKWTRQADVDAGVKPESTTTDNTELREARRRIKLLEHLAKP